MLGYGYGSSPLVVPDGAPVPAEDPVSYVPSASPGSLLPHVWLDETTSLYDLLGNGFTLLVDRDSLGGRPAGQAYAAALAAAAVRGIPLAVVAVGPDQHGTAMATQWQADAVLVRPDQHVAWRGTDPAKAAAAIGVAAGWPLATPSEDPDRSSRVRAVIP